jgi:hypothetical protein
MKKIMLFASVSSLICGLVFPVYSQSITSIPNGSTLIRTSQALKLKPNFQNVSFKLDSSKQNILITGELVNNNNVPIPGGFIKYRVIGFQGIVLEDGGVIMYGKMEPGQRTKFNRIVLDNNRGNTYNIRLEVID